MSENNAVSLFALLDKYRNECFSERDKGTRFERLMQAWLRTDPLYARDVETVWLWNEFPFRSDFGGRDTGIDLVVRTVDGEFWAVQCKFYAPDTTITKASVDTFLSTSSRTFDDGKAFSRRLWISTGEHWNGEAENTVANQIIPFTRISLTDLSLSEVRWDELDKGIYGEKALAAKKRLRPHQEKAVAAVHEHFKDHDRGRLIMACGTGKTFTSLKIAEQEAKRVLFLVPSIALLGQTLREWTAQTDTPIYPVCVCSDAEITRDKKKGEDAAVSKIIDLAMPASTNIPTVVSRLRSAAAKDGMTVVFSTYQSIDVISQAQKRSGFEFDLIVCDEAHRTTGAIKDKEDESAFTKVHDNAFIKAKKRLYMTATPRLYRDDVKEKAKREDILLCSMDDPAIYGKEIYRIGFAESVKTGLLSDYKVLVLTLNENDVPSALQKAIADKTKEISTDDASKLMGCINALSKRMLIDEGLLKETDPEPMRRAVAFCQTIEKSKRISDVFNTYKTDFYDSLSEADRAETVDVFARHIDGSMNALERGERMEWLKSAPANANECRILTNVRCLSEGVDVPTLDAVMFLSARNSQIDVVQSVGRVMRKADGKKYGYIIIPVVIPANVEPEKALDDNDRFAVVWSVLNALRAHDDRFNAFVNKIELNKKKPDNILIGGTATLRSANEASITEKDLYEQLAFQFDGLQNAIYARMVKKVGNRHYWEQWAKDVADIAARHQARIERLIAEDELARDAFDEFLSGLHKNINPSVTQNEALDMLAQHLITKPVFEALFENTSFVKTNAVSVAMQKIIDLLDKQAFDKDRETLNKFYESVKERVEGIDNAEGKQKIIVELYDKFFKVAMPKTVEKLGIVYTPVEVVDFIVRSVADVLKQEFNRSISDENVHILDPFTRTGTFITRLIQSGLIKDKDLKRKYEKELHANEILLLPYYIASVNIENSFNELFKGENFIPFNGICLTDTFQLGETDESEELFSSIFPQNSERVIAQKKAPLRIIMGNPPYSVGQKSANDNAQNLKYEKLDARVADTYVKNTNVTNKNKLYDTYIKAFRWASDRLDPVNGGIVGFITNGIWLDNASMDGFRKCLEKEFSAIYIFNLRGGVRGKSGDLAKREGQNVFNIMTGVAITILVKNPKVKRDKAEIRYRDIGDYLTREQKFDIIKENKSVLSPDFPTEIITPNEHGDWLSQRNDTFNQFIPLNCEKKFLPTSSSFFSTYSLGLATGRDVWVSGYSKEKVIFNTDSMIDFYNQQVDRYNKIQEKSKNIDDDIDLNPQKISWNRNLKEDLLSNKKHKLVINDIVYCSYRPFSKSFLYFNKDLNAMLYQQKKFFPNDTLNNICICISSDVRKGFSTLIANNIPDLSFVAGAQCFPLYWYEKVEHIQRGFFDTQDSDYVRHNGITDFILDQARQIDYKITKEDIFYYVYGFLHCPEYRETFAADLKKMLPRIPLIDNPVDFWAFSKAGRDLAELHLNYETVAPCPDVIVEGAEHGIFRLEKMRFKSKDDKSTIVFNPSITVSNIPLKAYDYVVNGRSAIEWVMERYQIKTDKDSGITNDPNDWAIEHGQPRYILDLLLSVINVSLQSLDIIAALPKPDFTEKKNE
ncbi:MAG: DEAD/DEAH box helicase [Alphaproteobacteria bacterium]|nr:DEAD/DEAH box helicase [Alphaproteobacteria bacterium]